MRTACLLVLALLALSAPAPAATWSTTCSNALITAGFCPAAALGQPVIVLGWGLAPADAQRLAAAVCGRDNWQGVEDPNGLTCAQFAERQLRRHLQRLVREWEIQQRVEAEREAAEDEVEEPSADGKTLEQSTRSGPTLEGGRP